MIRRRSLDNSPKSPNSFGFHSLIMVICDHHYLNNRGYAVVGGFNECQVNLAI